jgi:hypothetical protein
MQGTGKNGSTPREPKQSYGWVSGKSGKDPTKRVKGFVDRPIPKPTTDLGFSGITHKTSGRTLRRPSNPTRSAN